MTPLSDDNLDHLRGLVDRPDLTGTKYKVIKPIARGGMGTVYLVRDQDLDRELALKVLTVQDDSGELVRRMLAEAKLMARLEHPSIVPIHDVGHLPDSRVYYVMKFVQGETLRQFLRRKPSESEKLDLIRRVCEAVAFAHSRGVVHRDLKPDNIMVGAFGEVLVMDWGVARVLAEDGPEPGPRENAGPVDSKETSNVPTSDGSIIGTPAFMAPEQAQGRLEQIDRRTDIFALGATLYYLLTGRPPIEADSPAETRQKVMEGNIAAPRERDKSVPKLLSAICMKALSVRKIDRYPDALSLAQDISRYQAGEPVSAYAENIFERAGRWTSRNQFVVYILIAYIVIRVLIFFVLGR